MRRVHGSKASTRGQGQQVASPPLNSSHQAILRLQSCCGNQAVSRLIGSSGKWPVVQRYVEINPVNYTALPNADFPSITEGKTTYERKRQIKLTATPDLNYSVAPDAGAGLAMAVQSQETEPKVFYATSNVQQASNDKLEQIGAKVRLLPAGGSIKVPKDVGAPVLGEDHELLKLRHAADEGAGLQLTEIIGGLAVTECNAVVELILGAATAGSRVAVLSGDTEIVAPSANEPTPDIAEFAATKAGGATELAGDLKAKGDAGAKADRLPKEYLDLGQVDQSKRSRELGINEAAVPEVGEGYVITSHKGGVPQGADAKMSVDQYEQALDDLSTVEEKKIHESGSLNALKQGQSWSYHYAGVVAKIGSDTVSLENYNRLQSYKWQIDQMYSELFKAEAVFRDFVRARLLEEQDKVPEKDRTDIPTLLTPRVQKWRSWGKKWQENSALIAGAKGDAEGRIDEAVGKIEASLKELVKDWATLSYFRMYGTGHGQSFHEQWKDSVANPITLRVRESVPQARAASVQELDRIRNGLSSSIGRVRVGLNSPATLLQPLEQEIADAYDVAADEVATATTFEEVKGAENRGVAALDLKKAALRGALLEKAAEVAGNKKFTAQDDRKAAANLIDTWIEEWSVEAEESSWFGWSKASKAKAPSVRIQLPLLKNEILKP